MHRQLSIIICGLAVSVAPAAFAQQVQDSDSASATDGAAVETEAPEPQDPTQLLGGHLGLAAGGRTSPGGLEIGGSYLYRLTETDWLDSGVGFTFGSGSAACFTDRNGEVLCDHGLLEGFSAEVSAAVRREFPGQGTFTPYARVGIGVRLVSFGDDDVKGAAFPVIVGGGVRSEVAERVAVFGGADLRAGVGLLTGDVGVEPHLSMTVFFGVEFRLD